MNKILHAQKLQEKAHLPGIVDPGRPGTEERCKESKMRECESVSFGL